MPKVHLYSIVYISVCFFNTVIQNLLSKYHSYHLSEIKWRSCLIIFTRFFVNFSFPRGSQGSPPRPSWTIWTILLPKSIKAETSVDTAQGWSPWTPTKEDSPFQYKKTKAHQNLTWTLKKGFILHFKGWGRLKNRKPSCLDARMWLLCGEKREKEETLNPSNTVSTAR